MLHTIEYAICNAHNNATGCVAAYVAQLMGAYEIRDAFSLDQLKLQLIIIKMKLKKTSEAIIRIVRILVSSTNATAKNNT